MSNDFATHSHVRVNCYIKVNSPLHHFLRAGVYPDEGGCLYSYYKKFADKKNAEIERWQRNSLGALRLFLK